jgi:hypothetical protein
VPELLTPDLRFYETRAGRAVVALDIPNKRAQRKGNGPFLSTGLIGPPGPSAVFDDHAGSGRYSAGVAFPAFCDIRLRAGLVGDPGPRRAHCT